jgi:hypothetical protein
MDIDPSSAAHADGGGDLWPFDSLTTSLLFSSSPPLHPLPGTSSSWMLTPQSPLWLFDDRQMMPIEVGPAPAAEDISIPAPVAAADDVHRARSGKLSLHFHFTSPGITCRFILFRLPGGSYDLERFQHKAAAYV